MSISEEKSTPTVVSISPVIAAFAPAFIHFSPCWQEAFFPPQASTVNREV